MVSEDSYSPTLLPILLRPEDLSCGKYTKFGIIALHTLVVL